MVASVPYAELFQPRQLVADRPRCGSVLHVRLGVRATGARQVSTCSFARGAIRYFSHRDAYDSCRIGYTTIYWRRMSISPSNSAGPSIRPRIRH